MKKYTSYCTLYLKKKRNNSEIHNTVSIHNIFCTVNNITFKVNQEKDKIFQILVPKTIFYSVILWKFGIKLEIQLITNFNHIQKICQK